MAKKRTAKQKIAAAKLASRASKRNHASRSAWRNAAEQLEVEHKKSLPPSEIDQQRGYSG